MLRATLLLAIASATTAFGQSPGPNTDVLFAFQGLASSPTIKMVLDGTETVNGRGKRVRVETSYLSASTASGTVIGLVEVLETQDGKLTQRCVGDGQTLWIYNVAPNEYMAIPYGEAGASNYYAKLADGLSSQVQGFGAHTVRFLRDILYRRDSMGSLGATFRSWTPGFTPTVWTMAGGPQPDPILSTRTFRPDETRYFVNYANGTSPSKSLTFEFEAGASTYELVYAYNSEVMPIGRSNRLLEWQMSFTKTGLTFAPETFRFVPPSTARAVPAPKVGS